MESQDDNCPIDCLEIIAGAAPTPFRGRGNLIKMDRALTSDYAKFPRIIPRAGPLQSRFVETPNV